MVISPWAKSNFVDHTQTDQSSLLLFIENNWNLGKVGGGSFDAIANPITTMFDFSQPTPQNATPVMLSPTTGLRQ
jgi:phospholipase C